MRNIPLKYHEKYSFLSEFNFIAYILIHYMPLLVRERDEAGRIVETQTRGANEILLHFNIQNHMAPVLGARGH